MKVLITGGAGFIGSYLAVKIVGLGCEVVVLDSLSEQIHGPTPNLKPLRDKGVEVLKGCITNRGDVDNALVGVDTVFHLAAETGTGQSMYEIERYTNVNVTGTGVLLDAISASGKVKKIILSSSRSVYGEGEYNCKTCGVVYPSGRSEKDMLEGEFEPRCSICKSFISPKATTEEANFSPQSIYAATKLSQEHLIQSYSAAADISCCILRLQNVYGPGQSLKNPYTGILSIFSNLFRRNESVNIFEDGNESRDFVYVDDVTDAFVCCLSYKKKLGIFNVGSGVATSVVTVANELKEAYCSTSKISITGQFRMGDIRHNYACMESAKSELNFEAKTPFDEGVKKFVSWVKGNEIQNVDGYKRSLEEMRSAGLLK